MTETNQNDKFGVYASRQDKKDASVAGVRVEWAGGEKLLRAVASPAAAAAVRSAAGEGDEDSLREFLSGLAMPSDWVESVMKERKMTEGRNGVASIQPKVAGLTTQDLSHVVQLPARAGLPPLVFCTIDPNDTDHDFTVCGGLHEGDYLWPEQIGEDKGRVVLRQEILAAQRKAKPKTYTLQQLISDRAAGEKFGVTGTLLQTLVRRALVDAEGAAAACQAAIREAGFSQVEVSGKGFAKSRTAAAAALKLAASHLPTMSDAVECSMIGDLIFMHHPDFGSKSPWVVGGPMRYIESVKHMHTLAVHWGVAAATFLFCYECEMLDLRGADHDNTPAAGIVVHQASEDGIEPWGNAELDLSAQQRLQLQALSAQIMPVRRQENGPVVASAVRVTDHYVLLNDHIFEDTHGDVYVGNAVAAPVHGIAHDLWCAESPGVSVPWLLRDVQVGERAVLVYSVGEVTEMSAEVTVMSVSGRTVLVSKPPEARTGVSGAALVSLEDFALLGIHCGVTTNNAVACAFNGETFALLADHARAAHVSRSEATSENDGNVYNVFRQKGLRNVLDRVIETTVGLYDGPEHVAMGTCIGDTVITVCDPENTRETLSVGKSSPVVWEKQSGGTFSAEVPRDFVDTGGFGPALVRRVAPGEKVVVVGRDERSPYFSEVVPVKHVGVAAVTFNIASFAEDGLPLMGGMVVAMRDGAVVGIYTGPVADKKRGILGSCVCFKQRPKSQETRVNLVEVLRNKFPMLTPEAWDSVALEGVFSHKSHSGADVMLSYAMIGDAVAKIESCKAYMDVGFPYSRWTIRNSKYLSNKSMAVRSKEIGLHHYIKTGIGLNLSNQSSAYADLLEALIGLASFYETPETLTKFCLVVVPGLADVSEGDETPRVDTFGFASEEAVSP